MIFHVFLPFMNSLCITELRSTLLGSPMSKARIFLEMVESACKLCSPLLTFCRCCYHIRHGTGISWPSRASASDHFTICSDYLRPGGTSPSFPGTYDLPLAALACYRRLLRGVSSWIPGFVLDGFSFGCYSYWAVLVP